MRRAKILAVIALVISLNLLFGGISHYGHKKPVKTSQAVGCSDKRINSGSTGTNADAHGVERESRQHKTQVGFSTYSEPGIESRTRDFVGGVRQAGKAVYSDPVSRGGDWGDSDLSSRFRPRIFTITAYNAGRESTGKGPGDPGYRLTTSGKEVQEGRTVSSDWSVLPAGTVIEIEGLPGTYVVEDTGGAIKGNRLDLYFESVRDAREWGRQKRVVRVVG